MKRILAGFSMLWAYPVLAQEASEKTGIGGMYYLGIGLVIFLALFAVYSIYEKIRNSREDRAERAAEAARQARLQNSEQAKSNNRS